jgi:signal transduction histidine kinase
VQLRGRFSLWFALAALVPIAVAAMVTRYLLARSYREEHERTRVDAQSAVRREIEDVEADVEAKLAPEVLGRDHDLIGRILLKLDQNELDDGDLGAIDDRAGPIMNGLQLDVLVVTAPGGRVIVAPHFEGMFAERGYGGPEKLARATSGEAFFTWEKRKRPEDRTPQSMLVASAARFVSQGSARIAIQVGRQVDPSMIEGVRSDGRVDTRLVAADGRVLISPAEADWEKMAGGAPIRVPLLGADGEPVAWVEIAVNDDQLDALLTQITLVSGVLAGAALALTVLLGLLVARRMTRDLDRLVEGAEAAARGDLEHRVTVASKDEVESVASALNLMMEDLRTAKERAVVAERIAAWQEVARRLAHEVKNPLTPIQMAMDTLRKTWRTKHPKFDEVIEESTATVLEEADRLKRIVTEFSEFARMPKPTFGPTDVADVVTSALGLYQGAAPVEHTPGDALPLIEADRGQLTQVLLNLLENARDAIALRGEPGGGRIVVTTRRGDAGDRVEIVVEDNGPGVPTDIKDRMFTPYFTTKQGKGGTGLGLAIVHRIVSDHGGRVLVGDAAGGGARFAVELPLKQGQALLASRI